MAKLVLFVVGNIFGAFLAWLGGRRYRREQAAQYDEALACARQLTAELEATQREYNLQRELANRRRARLSEVEARLERLQSSFDVLRRRETESGAQAQTDLYLNLFDKLAGVLVQLPTVEHAIGQGADISSRDVLALVAPLYQAVGDIGFEPIGAPGAQTTFDPRLHQCAETCREGQLVCVKFVGYRYGDQILRRAQVGVEID
jgi:molecular chaperone GrpE (heat shock protein)